MTEKENLLIYLEVAVGVQSSTCEVWNVPGPCPAHILVREDKQMDPTALMDALFGH